MRIRNTVVYSLALFLLVFYSTPALSEAKRFEAADSNGVEASRDDRAVYLKVKPGRKGSIAIPRLAAPLRSMHWQGHEPGGITLKPEPDRWVIRWEGRPEDALTLVLNFDDPPLLPDEVKPIEAAGDGSFFLPAHLAKTGNKKIRYEPQPHKNTVGFWTDPEDIAGWNIKLDKPGRFNVAVLQGCGKGQGGSTARIGFMEPVPVEENPKIDSIDFSVLETGHFQNFLWCHLGEIELKQAGEIGVFVMPLEISKAALMDIRAIHLIRLPDKK